MKSPIRLTFLALLLAVLGCSHPTTNVTVEASASITPQDFALDVVVGLLKAGANDAAGLEAKINDPASGINNVDLDKDGKTDYVQVVESQIPTGRKMELIAHASSGASPDISIAGIKFSQSGGGVDVEAGYAPLIDPGGRYYYHDSLASDLLFAQWLFMPSRPMYFVHPIPMGYVYRPRVPVSTFTSTRSTFTSTTRVSPVRATPRPASFNAGRITSPPRAPATTLGGAARGVSGFSVDSRAKPAGVGFGGSSTPRPSSPSSPASRPSSPSFRRSSPSLGGGRRR